MKSAIIYYSMSGNTKYAAEKIAKTINADIIEIHPVKAYPDKGMKKFIWGGKSAVMGDTPKLMPYDFNTDLYDKVIIGTPVWASCFTPPIKTFIQENKDIREKKLAVFTCFSGGGADKAINKMKKEIGIDIFMAELILVDPKDKVCAENEKKIEEFCALLL